MADHSVEYPSPPSLKTVVRGVLWFLLFSASGLALAIWWKKPAGFNVFLEHLQGTSLVLLVPLVGADYLLGGLRYRLFFDGKILPKISLWDCMRSNWANIFMGAITPFQTGGGPAQLYILWRCGAKISQAALVSIINFLSTLFFFQIAGLIAILFLPSDLFGSDLTPILRAGFLVVAGITVLVLLVLIFPTAGLSATRLLFRVIPPRFTRLHALRDRLLTVLGSGIQQFRSDFSQIRRRHRMLLLVVLIATSALFFNKFLIGYVIARSLQQAVPWGTFVGLQILQFFLIYFAPTPGASGIAEFSSTWFLEPIMSADLLVFFAVTWRFFTTVLGAILGGLVLLLDVRAWVKSRLSSVHHGPPPPP